MAVLFPVVGVTEWSRGSWMPGTKNHRGRTHGAIDIYADRGSPIIAPVTGVIKSVGSSSIGGNWIQLQGDDGYTYYFAHMNTPTILAKGERVSGGALLGVVGNSGSARSTSTHVHFSIKRDGVLVSPIKMLETGVVVPNVGTFGNEKGMTKKGSGGKGGIISVPGQIPSGVAQQTAELYDYDTTPSTEAQFAQYREELAALYPQMNPVKQKASAAVRSSLQGMAAMVREYGFNTGEDPDTGISEDIGQVERVRVEDGPTPR